MIRIFIILTLFYSGLAFSECEEYFEGSTIWQGCMETVSTYTTEEKIQEKYELITDHFTKQKDMNSFKLFREYYVSKNQFIEKKCMFFNAHNHFNSRGIAECQTKEKEKLNQELDSVLIIYSIQNSPNQALKAQPSAAGTPQSGAP